MAAANSRRLNSNAIEYWLSALRRDEPNAFAMLRDGLEWLVYAYARPVISRSRRCYGQQIIRAEELLGPLGEGLCDALKRLAKNEASNGWRSTLSSARKDRCDPVEKFIRDELRRVRREMIKAARAEIAPPASTQSTRKAKGQPLHNTLRQVSAFFIGGRDDDENESVAVAKQAGKRELQRSSNGTILDDPVSGKSSDKCRNRQSSYAIGAKPHELWVDRGLDLASRKEADGWKLDPLDLRILELADVGWSANVIAAMVERPTANVVQRINALRKRAKLSGDVCQVAKECGVTLAEARRRLDKGENRYSPPPRPKYDYSKSQLLDCGIEHHDEPCADGCARPATVRTKDGLWKCWPCHYQKECPRLCPTARDGVIGDRDYYSAQPADGHKRPILNDAGLPTRSLGVRLPRIPHHHFVSNRPEHVSRWRSKNHLATLTNPR